MFCSVDLITLLCNVGQTNNPTIINKTMRTYTIYLGINKDAYTYYYANKLSKIPFSDYGIVVGKDCRIEDNCVIDNDVFIFDGCLIKNDVNIGYGSIVKSGCIIAKNTTIKENCYFGDGCVIAPYTTIKKHSRFADHTILTHNANMLY